MTTTTPTTYTLADVSTAVNAGADTVRDGLDLGDRDTDLVNLVANAVMTTLTTPEAADLDAVIDANYDEDEDVRGSWDW